MQKYYPAILCNPFRTWRNYSNRFCYLSVIFNLYLFVLNYIHNAYAYIIVIILFYYQLISIIYRLSIILGNMPGAVSHPSLSLFLSFWCVHRLMSHISWKWNHVYFEFNLFRSFRIKFTHSVPIHLSSHGPSEQSISWSQQLLQIIKTKLKIQQKNAISQLSAKFFMSVGIQNYFICSFIYYHYYYNSLRVEFAPLYT